LAFNPDDPTFLAAAYSDGTLHLWNVDTEQTVVQSRTPDNLPAGALIFADALQVAAYSPGLLTLWDTDQNITSTIKVGSTASLAAMSPVADIVVTAGEPSERALTLFDLENETREVLNAHTDQIASLAASSDGRWLASSGVNGEVVLWRMQGSPVSREPLAVGGNIAGAIFSADQQQIVMADPVQVTWWDHASTHIIAQQPLTQAISSAAASPVHDLLAVGASDGTIELWSISQQQPVDNLITGYVAPLNQLAFSSDGQWLAGLDSSGYLSVTELATGQPWQPQSDLSVGVTAIAFHPITPNLLAVGRSDGSVWWYDVADGQSTTNPLTTTSPAPVDHLAFSSDGRELAASSLGAVYLWDVETGADLPALQIEGGDVTSLLFNRDGQTLIIGMSDNSIILWDIAAGRRLGTLRGHTGPVNVLALSPDGKTLVSGSDDATVVLWQIDEEDWKRIACHTAGRNLTLEEWRRYFGQESYRVTCPYTAQ
jgi:WD40 repeat protein